MRLDAGRRGAAPYGGLLELTTDAGVRFIKKAARGRLFSLFFLGRGRVEHLFLPAEPATVWAAHIARASRVHRPQNGGIGRHITMPTGAAGVKARLLLENSKIRKN